MASATVTDGKTFHHGTAAAEPAAAATGVYVALGDCIRAAAATAPRASLPLLRRLLLLRLLLLRLAACCCLGGAAGQEPTSHQQAQPAPDNQRQQKQPKPVSTEGTLNRHAYTE